MMPPKRSKSNLKTVAKKAKTKKTTKEAADESNAVATRKPSTKSNGGKPSTSGDSDSPSKGTRGAVTKSKVKSNEKGSSNAIQKKKKGPLAFDIKGLSMKQYAKWKPMRKETEKYLNRIFETNTNLVLSAMRSGSDYDKCQELLNGLTASFMEGLKEAKFPKPATVNFMQLKEKMTQLESQLEMSTDLYDRVQSTYEEYELMVEKLEEEKNRLEDMLNSEETPLPQQKDLNPVLKDVLSTPLLPDMITLDEKSNPAYINRAPVNSMKNYMELRSRCEEIAESLPEKHQ